jgi:hypothetical protein
VSDSQTEVLKSIFIAFGIRTEQMRIAYNILVGKADGKRPLVRPRSRWEDNIIMDLR